MAKMYLSFILITLLAGCAGSRETPGDFVSVSQGNIPTDKVPEFIDCVSAQFQDKQIGLQQKLNRQQRRSDGYRVELINTGRGLVLSADIFDDGRVELFRRVGAVFIETEINGYLSCFDKYKVN